MWYNFLLTIYRKGVDVVAPADHLNSEWFTSNRPVEGNTYAVHYQVRYSYLSSGVQDPLSTRPVS